MSKISYCSLEEAWGNSFAKNNEQNINNIDNIRQNNINNEENNINNEEKNINNNNKLNIYNREIDKYNILTEKSGNDREIVISNMNNIERNPRTENNSLVQYQKYRFNPTNNVNNNDQQLYSPFNESLERKYLQDKLYFLENEIRKYRNLFESTDKNNQNKYQNSNQNIIESFSNQDINNNGNKSNDIIDLILLIMIGLIVIFVMNSIFNIGKAIGSKK
jgi:hypothetical protein